MPLRSVEFYVSGKEVHPSLIDDQTLSALTATSFSKPKDLQSITMASFDFSGKVVSTSMTKQNLLKMLTLIRLPSQALGPAWAWLPPDFLLSVVLRYP